MFSKREGQWLDLCEKIIGRPLIRGHTIKIANRRWIRPDGFDPKTNTVYEFYGDYYHGNLNVFKETDLVPGYLTAGEAYNKTKMRQIDLINIGYKIAYIWENEFKLMNKGKSNLLAKVLHPNCISIPLTMPSIQT